MLLTLYYIAATYLQSWRIRTICNKITEKLAEKASVVFYNVSSDINDVTATLATSDICTNRSQARISDVLFLRGNKRGCSLVPIQNLHLGPWVSFPDPPNLIPFDFGAPAQELQIDKQNSVHLLLETDILPNTNVDEDEMLMIEEYGKPLAWKVDSHFAVLLESDINHFTKLVMSTFMQDNFSINDRLPLIRIESVHFEGDPQPYNLIKNHLRKQLTSRAMRQLSTSDWEKHLAALRSLSVLANQATEFEYNKNRTEGKTGIVKPDLIPSKTIDNAIVLPSPQKLSPGKKLSPSPKHSPVKIEAKISPIRQVIGEKRPVQEDIVKEGLKINQPLVEKPKQLSPKHSPVKTAAAIKREEPSTSKTVLAIKKDDSAHQFKKESHKEGSNKAISPVSKPEAQEPTDTKQKVLVADSLPKPVEFVNDKIAPSAVVKPIAKAPEIVTANKDNTKRPGLKRNKGSLNASKPPNVLVYSDSITTRDNAIKTLKRILEKHTYTIYPLTPQQVQEKVWIDNTSLLIICGPVEGEVGEILLDYFLKGGKMLSLCSDVLHIILPTYRTAEVREHELVQFSYDKWQKIKMMHHIFCYQPSPVKKHFSQDGELAPPPLTKRPALVCPRSVEVKDLQGELHSLDVKVLGVEETWNTPSLLLATNVKSGGKAVFSQVHLEADPSQFEHDEIKYSVLKQSEKARHEIFSDLLKSHLSVIVKKSDDGAEIKDSYKSAYFLGRHESKFELLEKLKPKMESENLIKMKNLNIKFCGKGETPPEATENLLPILIHSCPEDFSTVDYFDNLRSETVGRIVIYAPVITSTMNIISDMPLTSGIAIIARQQTNGSGRNQNQWLSPEGCLMFSVQLHIPIKSTLGQRLSLMQHLTATAMVNAVHNIPGYEELDLNLKWPNDIYANGISKIGGLIVTSMVYEDLAICNLGCALNLGNSMPTTCINDLIRDYNRNLNKNIPVLSFERALASIFNELERLINQLQSGDFQHLYDLYYKFWLHSDQMVTIVDKNKRRREVKIIGIDDYGFLKVQTNEGKLDSVHPDGNSFDMLQGLIIPK